VTLADTDRARDLLLAHPWISARDAVHAGVMLTRGLDQIATFDRGFERVTGVTRIDLP
jgi:predicted nucleic acid-binding protein